MKEPKKDKKAVYRVIEADVDGCGGDAEEYVKFDRKLTNSECDAFRDALRKAKADERYQDTADMVTAAIRIAGLDGIGGKVCTTPFEGEFDF